MRTASRITYSKNQRRPEIPCPDGVPHFFFSLDSTEKLCYNLKKQVYQRRKAAGRNQPVSLLPLFFVNEPDSAYYT